MVSNSYQFGKENMFIIFSKPKSVFYSVKVGYRLIGTPSDYTPMKQKWPRFFYRQCDKLRGSTFDGQRNPLAQLPLR